MTLFKTFFVILAPAKGGSSLGGNARIWILSQAENDVERNCFSVQNSMD